MTNEAEPQTTRWLIQKIKALSDAVYAQPEDLTELKVSIEVFSALALSGEMDVNLGEGNMETLSGTMKNRPLTITTEEYFKSELDNFIQW